MKGQAMRILISAASKHGATGQIAQRVADTLTEAGLETVVIPAEQVTTLTGFDAVVLGSAVYMGHWLAPARDLAERLAREADGRPVWLFSSGPLGDPPKPEQDAVDVAPLLAATGARGHQVFSGRLVRKQLSFPERAVTAALRVADRDDRDWTEIAAWARKIGEALSAETTETPRST